MNQRVTLTKHQGYHVVWAVINFLLADACLEYTYTMYPMIFPGDLEAAEVFHPALLPQELLPLILLMWLIGHIIILVKFRR